MGLAFAAEQPFRQGVDLDNEAIVGTTSLDDQPRGQFVASQRVSITLGKSGGFSLSRLLPVTSTGDMSPPVVRVSAYGQWILSSECH